VYFVEFLEPRPGVDLERFQQVVRRFTEEWAREHPQDELVLNIGRTWWLGPAPAYITVWRVEGAATLDRWRGEIAALEPGGLHEEFAEVATIVHTGLYEDIGDEIA